jgi:hypothetical protein
MKKIIIPVLLTVLSITCFSQSSLYISAGANVVVSGGTALVVDGFSIKPTAVYTIPGANSVTRGSVTVVPTPGAHINRVYHFLSNVPAFTGEVTHYYTDGELNGLTENVLTLTVYNGTAWTLYPAATRDNVNNFVTTSGLTNLVFNEATLADAQALPVTLTNIRAYQKNAGVQVDWRAEQELNIDRYEAERSYPGTQFTSIGSISSRNNNNATVNYGVFDPAPGIGVNLYRIKIINQSGEIKYSSIVKINMGAAAGSMSIYPNPVTGNNIGVQMNSMTAGIYTVRITNKIGQIIFSKIISHPGGSATEMVELPKSLTRGIYQLRVTGGGAGLSEQVIRLF